MSAPVTEPGTKLPWRLVGNGLAIAGAPGEGEIARASERFMDRKEREANAAYIVTACNAYPDLVALVREMRERLRTKRDYVADAASGGLTYEGSGDGFKAMAAEDLAEIGATLAKASELVGE